MNFSLSRFRQSLMPDTDSLLHLTALAEALRSAVDRVAQLMGSSPEDSDDLDVELARIDADATTRHMRLMTSLRSAFITPLPRQDLYIYSDGLNHAVEQVCNAGLVIRATEQYRLPPEAMDLLEIFARQADLLQDAASQFNTLDELEETWIQLQRAGKRAERILTRWVTSMTGDLLQRSYNRQREVAHALAAVQATLRQVTVHLGRVLVRES